MARDVTRRTLLRAGAASPLVEVGVRSADDATATTRNRTAVERAVRDAVASAAERLGVDLDEHALDRLVDLAVTAERTVPHHAAS